ncbi:HlyD family type I secretion periplasmic adaptor subunit [Thalassospiraceae bacterium LMO-JJ14]|nr:HlyD family type I secretion periplasmic adaptor subunit [Thalassospiraceae bacterium LMO-JJ14]
MDTHTPRKAQAPAPKGPPPPIPGAPMIADEGFLVGRGALAQSLMLEERGPSHLIRLAGFFVCVMVCLFIAWAAITEITEVVVSSGEVSPIGSVKRIQHLEGGIVKEIFVGEGDLVKQGQVMIRLDDAGIVPERDQLVTRLSNLELRAQQLAAVISGEEFDLSKVAPRYRTLAKTQVEVLAAKREALEAQAEVLRDQLSQRRNELELLRDQVAGNKRQIQILKQQVGMRKTLEEKGLISKVILLNDQRELARAEGALAELVGKQKTAQNAIDEAESRLEEMESRSRMDTREQYAQVLGEIAELKETIELKSDQIQRLDIRSPVTGIAQELQTETVGGVIAPGSTVLEVIPNDAALFVEARISTQDIGFIYVGQEATVKVTAFDYTRYGGIDGIIQGFSATTVQDEEGSTFYRARIKLAKNYVGDDPERNRVLPGMEVIADIKTGKKTLLEFLLKPVVKALSESFRER